jgi:hypothetical protein
MASSGSGITGSRAGIEYYKWALEDARREVHEDFRLLRSVSGRIAGKARAFLEGVQAADRTATAVSLSRYFNGRFATLAGDSVSERDASVHRAWRQALIRPAYTDVPHLVPVTARSTREGRHHIVNALSGSVSTRLDTKTERFDRPYNGWMLSTTVELSIGRCSYFHNLTLSGENVLFNVSLLSWMGFSSQTTWDLIVPGEEDNAVARMAALCRHFCGAMENLL